MNEKPITEITLVESASIIQELRDTVAAMSAKINDLLTLPAPQPSSTSTYTSSVTSPTQVLVYHQRPEGTAVMKVLGAQIDGSGTLTVTVGG